MNKRRNLCVHTPEMWTYNYGVWGQGSDETDIEMLLYFIDEVLLIIFILFDVTYNYLMI